MCLLDAMKGLSIILCISPTSRMFLEEERVQLDFDRCRWYEVNELHAVLEHVQI